MSEQARRRLLRQLDRTINDTACAPELGVVQYMILVTIWALTPKATLNEVIDFIYKRNGDIVDVAQAFVIMQTFKKAKPPLIHETGKITSRAGRRPSACFQITNEGKEAIRSTEDHLRRLLAFGILAQQANVMVAERQPNEAKTKQQGKTKVPVQLNN